MANFSGVISSNDSTLSTICNGLVELILEWEVIRDLKNNTYKYLASVYLDATRCKYLSTVNKIDGYPSSGTAIYRHYPGELTPDGNDKYDWIGPPPGDEQYTKYSYFAPEFKMLTSDISKRIFLHSVESNAIPVGEEIQTIEFVAAVYPNDVWRAYEKNVINYVESRGAAYNYRESVEKIFEFRGIVPSSVNSISGSTVLGSSHSVNIKKNEPEFTHTVEYVVGETRVTICDKSAEEVINFTPDFSLADQNTHGTSLEATFYVHTYYGDTFKGTKTFDYSFTVPDTVKPSCSIEVTDGELKGSESVDSYYGGFVKGHSRFHIKVTPELAYGSPIKTYEVDVDGMVYTLTRPEMDTPMIKYSGEHMIKVRVIDYRGYASEYVSTSVSVQPYNAPVISDLKALRCDIDGSDNPKGGCMKVVFSSTVTPLGDKNTATYVVTHSKSSGLDYVEKVLNEFSGNYNIIDGVYIFPAELDSTYFVQLKVVDDFEEHTRMTGGGLTTTLMNWLASGHGMCFGGVATIEDAVECQFRFYPSGGLILTRYPYSTMDSKDCNIYYIDNPLDVEGCPVYESCILEIYHTSADGRNGVQRLTTCALGTAPKVIARSFTGESWGAFYNLATGQQV